jgi:hypothetical protein
MKTLPYHLLSRAYTADHPQWSTIDSGIDAMRLRNGVLQTRRVTSGPIRGIQAAIEALTEDDAEILWQFIADHEVDHFWWVDPKRGPLGKWLTYECCFDPANPPQITPTGSVMDRWNASMAILPVVPMAAVPMLVAWWPMDDGGTLLVGDDEALEVGTDEILGLGGGLDVYDATGNGHDGTASQTTELMAADGKLGGALSFNGTSDYVEIADAADLRLTDGGAILAWINPTSLGEGDAGRIVDKSTTATAGAGYAFALSAGNKLSFRVAGDAEPTLSSANAITLATWQHVAVVFDGYGRRLYVNGIDVTASGSDATRLPPASTAALRLGNRSGATDASFNGPVDDVRIYQRPLSRREILAIVNGGAGTTEEVVA